MVMRTWSVGLGIVVTRRSVGLWIWRKEISDCDSTALCTLPAAEPRHERHFQYARERGMGRKTLCAFGDAHQYVAFNMRRQLTNLNVHFLFLLCYIA
jgi:hypothetical protein